MTQAYADRDFQRRRALATLQRAAVESPEDPRVAKLARDLVERENEARRAQKAWLEREGANG